MDKCLHSSLVLLDIDTILKPKENYTEVWSQTDFYSTLEKYRPAHMLAHHESVFFCTNIADLDNCMEGEFLFEIIPNERVEKHDMNWSTEISCLRSINAPEEKLKEVALKYWNGVASSDPLWEFQTTSAKITKVHLYDDYEDSPLIKPKLKF